MVTYGAAFLDKLQKYYGGRLREARRLGLEDVVAPYHWLCRELELRVNMVEQVKLFLGLVHQYLQCSTLERTMTFTAEFVVVWFDEKNVGRMPEDPQGQCIYFARDNPYWTQVRMAGEEIGRREKVRDTSYRAQSICEYVLCCLRLYFYIREKQFRSIDREYFQQLMEPIPGGDYLR